MELFLDVFRNTILITGLIMVMMMMIEYIHIYSQGQSFARLQHHPFRQIALSALLGLVPGCVGGFAVVSLFSHGIISFGALLAMMISTVGDEAFLLFAIVPQTALWLTCLLFPLALLMGWAADRWIKKGKTPLYSDTHYALHHEDGCHHGAHAAVWGNWKEHLRSLSPKRTILLIALLLFIAAMGLGLLEHDHAHALHADLHQSHDLNLFSERWLNLLFAVLSVLTLIFTLMASEHFISEHLWGHIFAKHLPKIFLWTFGALLCISLGMLYLDMDKWVAQNGYFVLLIAALIGLIPESGPHMIFIALFASGAAPFSVLFTSCFVQDGHTALPLLAESKSAFIKAKVIKLCAGVAIGSLLYFCGV